jgi:hypothetical protein
MHNMVQGNRIEPPKQYYRECGVDTRAIDRDRTDILELDLVTHAPWSTLFVLLDELLERRRCPGGDPVGKRQPVELTEGRGYDG